MSAPKAGSEMAGLHKELCRVMRESLRGEPLLVGENNDTPVLHPDGTPVYVQPKAATLREIREFLRDHGIDEEPGEGSEIHKVAKAIRKYDDDLSDPFLLDSMKSTS